VCKGYSCAEGFVGRGLRQVDRRSEPGPGAVTTRPQNWACMVECKAHAPSRPTGTVTASSVREPSVRHLNRRPRNWTLPVLGRAPQSTAARGRGPYPDWSGATVYEWDTRLLFDGKPFESKWWNQGKSRPLSRPIPTVRHGRRSLRTRWPRSWRRQSLPPDRVRAAQTPRAPR
jgi:hypothetical protein